MPQAISGVTPSVEREVTVMTVWPSIAVYPDGRWLGRLYSIKAGVGVLTVGNLLALASIPHALFRYFYRLATGKCYKLTNRRIVELGTRCQFHGSFPVFFNIMIGGEVRAVELDRFDSIELVRQPGQAWFDAGDLIFKQGNVETFRLEGVSRPESFRQTCLKSRAAYVGVKQALQRQAVPA
jgi:hypothetical protein